MCYDYHVCLFFFFNDTATTEIYTLSLHDALPILVDAPIPEMRVHLGTALAVSIPLGAITATIMGLALKARRNKVVTGAQGLVGEIGVAQTPLSPAGKVFIHGELWDAVSSAHIAAGQRVVVRRVDGLQLEVEPVVQHSPVTATA